MMRNEINFNYNWNNKLAGKFFTTLRLKDETRFHIGETYAIMLKGKHVFDADIADIRHFYLKDINNFVAGLDTGYDAVECRKIITTMYKKSNINWDTRLLSLILFKKLKNQPFQAKETELLQESA